MYTGIHLSPKLLFFFEKYWFISLHQILVAAWGILFPDQALNPDPLCWESGVLAAEPLEKPQPPCFLVFYTANMSLVGK